MQSLPFDDEGNPYRAMDRRKLIENPYRPGAGQVPPFLSGRGSEIHSYKALLNQPHITESVLVTGLRGVGKTVLVDEFRRIAQANDWLVVANDLSESSSLTEERLGLRILTDIANALETRLPEAISLEFDAAGGSRFDALRRHYEQTPGLPVDKLLAVLKRVTSVLGRAKHSGLLLCYDEAQCLADHAEAQQFPMSMLIEAVSQLQKREGVTPCLLLLAGLPHVQDALAATRTYTERMFRVMPLDRLSIEDARTALYEPLTRLMPPLYASPALVDKVISMTGGYPYLVQFFGRELIDQLLANGGTLAPDDFPSPDALDRLDAGLFSARWSRTTDRQREVLWLIANRPGSSEEFSVKELVQLSRDDTLTDAAIQGHLAGLSERGLVFRTRHGRYALSIPMSEDMIARRFANGEVTALPPTGPAAPVRSAPPPAAGPSSRWRSWFR